MDLDLSLRALDLENQVIRQDMGAFFFCFFFYCWLGGTTADPGFNALVKASEDGELTSMVASRSLENARAHAESSWNTLIAMTDSRRRK